MTDKTKGILLIALGRPEYGNLAANLAASIRYTDRDVPIHLVHTDSSITHLIDQHKALFTSMSVCPVEYYTHNGKTEYLKAKTHIYDLTPYNETLFLDADMMFLPTKKASALIDRLSAVCDFTIENRGYADLSLPVEKLDPNYSTWCNILDVKKHYKTKGKFYHLHSEFIFFKKNDINQMFFETVREIYDTRPIKWTLFDGGVPDEYAFDIACCITGHYPHQENFIEIYWHGMDGRPDWNSVVAAKYSGFSLGGNILPDWISRKTDAYKALYKQGLKLNYMFPVLSKKSWNKQRSNI